MGTRHSEAARRSWVDPDVKSERSMAISRGMRNKQLTTSTVNRSLPSTRRCMCCQDPFVSAGNHNRLCPNCKNNDNYHAEPYHVHL